MMKNVFFAVVAILFTPYLLTAQADDKRLKEIQEAAKKDADGWVIGGGLGLDFAQLAMFNPRVGSGDNRIAFGGLGNIFANYKRGRKEWVSNISLQEAVQQLGGADWQKSLDVLRLNSKYSYQTSDERWSYAAVLTFESLAMPTYPGNFLVKQDDADGILAKFLSPARLELSPGINFKPNAQWNFFFAPASYKLIYVADQDIANLGIHGTQLVDETDPSLGYEKSFHQVGARFTAGYTNKFFKDRMTYTSRFDLFSNYLNNPQNIDVLWQNDLGWQLWKGLSLNFLLEGFYDHDILVQRKRPTETDPGELGRQTSWTQALLVKYNFIF
ncbi:MAG: DUF3078 domain-containing protein [Saprospiraceae bacterium]|nr:DUF3078 domain-containing protein [Saprospiraceae bacterium]